MAEVTLDDIQVALVPVSKKSVSVYKSVIILYKSIFRAAQESHVIDTNPTIYLNAKGGGIPQEDKQALTDEQAERLLDAIQGLPPYVFVMIGLYAGLRREEILALQWDSVYLDTEAPYLTVRQVVSRVILRGSALHYFAQRPMSSLMDAVSTTVRLNLSTIRLALAASSSNTRMSMVSSPFLTGMGAYKMP